MWMNRCFYPALALYLLPATMITAQAIAQTGSPSSGLVIDIGYQRPLRLFGLTRGQPIHVYAYGLRNLLPDAVRASGLPLPTQLANIRLEIRVPFPMDMPIFKVTPVTCLGIRNEIPCEPVVEITAQVPFEFPTGTIRDVWGSLIVYEQDRPVSETSIYTRTYSVHLIESPDARSLTFPKVRTQPWEPFVRHQDGRIVSELHPAEAGEELIVYAIGLPVFDPFAVGLRTGDGPSTDISTSINLQLKPGRHIEPTNPALDLNSTGVSARLLPNSVGVFEIRFRVPPELPADLPACYGGLIQSNMTVSIGYARPFTDRESFDGVGFCVRAGEGSE